MASRKLVADAINFRLEHLIAHLRLQRVRRNYDKHDADVPIRYVPRV